MNLKPVVGLRGVLFLIYSLFLLFFSYAQDVRPIADDSSASKDSLRISEPEKTGPNDSLSFVSDAGILLQTDSTAKTVPKKGDIETTINYSSRDSIFFDLKNQKLNMYGQTHIDYGDITLEAERTDVDMNKKAIHSIYVLDSAGKKVGRPVFTDAGETYETDKIAYNFETKRAQIRGVVTAQEGAFMHGDDVRKNEKDEMFIRGARYTTCNLSDPHFFIESQKIKVIPGNKVVSGPFNLRFREVVTPLWFPFGMFPQPKKRASGIIFPTYGEEERRGFFLRQGGYYFVLNDYFDLRVTGDIYTKGATALSLTTNYKVRYKFSGTYNFSFNRNLTDDLENPQDTKDFWVQWNHRQDSKGSSNFSAAVSMGTSTFNKNTNLVAQDFNRSINSRFSSNISYSKRFQGTPFMMSLAARQNQNLQTGIASMSLPELTVNTSRQYPFKKLISNGNNPLAKVNFSHNFVMRNEVTNATTNARYPFEVSNINSARNDTIDFWQAFPSLVSQGKIGGRHQIPLSTSMTLMKKLTLSPSVNYQEVWYNKELTYTWNPLDSAVIIDTLAGFSRASSWTSGASLNTIIYGTYFFKGKLADKIQAVRHVMTPSVSFSYNPDFGDPSLGVYQYVQKNVQGDSVRVSKYEGFLYGSPTGMESRTMGLSLNNNLEMKVRDKNDTTGVGFKKVKLFDNFSLNSGYNFAADSFNLGNINFTTRTSFFKNAISLTLSGIVDPYTYDLISESVLPTGVRKVSQQKIDRYAWESGNGLGNLSSITTAIGITLKPKGSKQKDEADINQNLPNDPFNKNGFGSELTEEEQRELAYISQNPDEYVDFNIPWNLRINYNFRRTQTGFQDAKITQSLSFNGDLSMTPNTKITFNSGYDFESREFTQTRIGVVRDLHCWSMNFNWVPFGRYKSFSLVIQPKSSMLQDLKIQRRRSFIDFFN